MTAHRAFVFGFAILTARRGAIDFCELIFDTPRCVRRGLYDPFSDIIAVHWFGLWQRVGQEGCVYEIVVNTSPDVSMLVFCHPLVPCVVSELPRTMDVF